MKTIEIPVWLHREAHFMSTMTIYNEHQAEHAYNNRKFQNKATLTIEVSDEEYDEYQKTMEEWEKQPKGFNVRKPS